MPVSDNICFVANFLGETLHLPQGVWVHNEVFMMSSGVKAFKEEPNGVTAADPNQPPPAKLLQDWARTPLPHVCPYCGKTFTRRVFLRTHVFSHTGEKLFTCKVPFKNRPVSCLGDNCICWKCHFRHAAAVVGVMQRL